MNRTARIALVFGGVVLGMAAPAFAQTATANLNISATVNKTCTITTTPVAFGIYDPVVTNASTPLDATGTVVVTCTKGAGTRIDLGNGGNFLRGFQRTDTNGKASFTTVYPGWYEGRAVHIHFKIRSPAQGARAQEFTSQLYFDESINDQVFKQAPYNSKRGRRVTNDGDFLFRRGGKELLLTLAKTAQGYTAKFDIGLQSS